MVFDLPYLPIGIATKARWIEQNSFIKLPSPGLSQHKFMGIIEDPSNGPAHRCQLRVLFTPCQASFGCVYMHHFHATRSQTYASCSGIGKKMQHPFFPRMLHRPWNHSMHMMFREKTQVPKISQPHKYRMSLQLN